MLHSLARPWARSAQREARHVHVLAPRRRLDEEELRDIELLVEMRPVERRLAAFEACDGQVTDEGAIGWRFTDEFGRVGDRSGQFVDTGGGHHEHAVSQLFDRRAQGDTPRRKRDQLQRFQRLALVALAQEPQGDVHALRSCPPDARRLRAGQRCQLADHALGRPHSHEQARHGSTLDKALARAAINSGRVTLAAVQSRYRWAVVFAAGCLVGAAAIAGCSDSSDETPQTTVQSTAAPAVGDAETDDTTARSDEGDDHEDAEDTSRDDDHVDDDGGRDSDDDSDHDDESDDRDDGHESDDDDDESDEDSGERDDEDDDGPDDDSDDESDDDSGDGSRYDSDERDDEDSGERDDDSEDDDSRDEGRDDEGRDDDDSDDRDDDDDSDDRDDDDDSDDRDDDDSDHGSRDDSDDRHDEDDDSDDRDNDAAAEPASTENRPEVLQLAVPQLNGDLFDVSSAAGRDVLLWFWAPW